MENLVEMVFEDVNKEYVIPLLERLIFLSDAIIGIDCSEGVIINHDGKLDVISLEKAINFDGDICVFIRLSELRIEGIIFHSVLVRLLKYENMYDIDFNLNLDEIVRKDETFLIGEIHQFAMKISNEYKIGSFYAGLEPASDKATRYFTEGEIGPLN
jgi:hypothetical protein